MNDAPDAVKDFEKMLADAGWEQPLGVPLEERIVALSAMWGRVLWGLTEEAGFNAASWRAAKDDLDRVIAGWCPPVQKAKP
jgi:hypothetical protein